MKQRSAILITRRALSHQGGWASAFADGLRRHGWQIKHATDYEKGDLVCIWSVRRGDMINRAKFDGCEVCILERGYVGDRFKYSSVSFGGELNGRAEFRGPLSDRSRWCQHFAHLMRDYDPPQDGYALIMGQVPGDMSLRGCDDIVGFYQMAAKALERQGWKVLFRAHPQAGRMFVRGHGIKTLGGKLVDAITGAGVVVTYNSNSGVDAALAGRPVIAMDRGSMAWDVAGHALDEIVMPDRSAWAHRLAWCQWSKDEMRSGECWEAIGQ